MTTDSVDDLSKLQRRRESLVRRCLRRVVKYVSAVCFAYVAIVLIGLIPVNNDFEPTPDGIPIGVISNAIHADLVLPIESEVIDWRTVFPSESFESDTSSATHIAIGWGDKGFFLETPTWGDLKVSTATRALLVPSPACMHVSMTNQARAKSAETVTISESQYQHLVDYIQQTLSKSPDDSVQIIADSAYGVNDVFLEAHGRYHALNTCNSWVGRGLKQAGIRTCLLSPLPKTSAWYFSESNR